MMFNDDSHEGLSSTDRVPGWEYSLQKSFARAITPDKPTTAPLTTLMDDCFGQVSRALAGGATGPEVFTLLLRLLSSRFDRTDTGVSYIILACLTGPSLAILAGNFEAWCRQRRGLSVFWPRGWRLLLVARMAENEQYPSLMPTLYQGVLATVSRPFGTWTPCGWLLRL